MILIIDMNAKRESLSFDEFVLPVAKLITRPYEIKRYSDVERVEGYERIIMCGAPVQDNQFVEDIRLFSWIKNYNLPILGICAGMQALALVHGSFLIPCREFGMAEVKTVKDNPLVSGEFSAYVVHGNAINLCPWFDVLAVSPACAQVIKHKEKPHYGVLFHPEVRNPGIIARFMGL